MNLKTDLLKPQQHVRTHKPLLEYKHKNQQAQHKAAQRSKLKYIETT